MDLKIFSVMNLGDVPEDEVPEGFWFREELERVAHCEETIDAGLIVREQFYKDDSLNDILLETSYEYPKDPATGAYHKQNATITYYYENGDQCEDTFQFTRDYTPRQQMKLFKKRRQTIRYFVEAAVLQMLIQTGYAPEDAKNVGAAFLADHNVALNEYEAAASTKFRDQVIAATDTWLDSVIDGNGTTIRQYILTEIAK